MRYLYILPILVILTIIIGFSGVSDTYAKENTKEKSPPTLIKFSKPQAFDLPIDCQIDKTCWVMNYVDMLPNDGKQSDPKCFSRTYDTHKGTDFAILDGETMDYGVNVLAALDGTIKKIRDGEPDQWSTDKQLDEIKLARKECGNAVIIDHGNDIQTIYCHMKKDSISVKPNQAVKAGNKIGEVGLSGLTQFPHLHFGVLKNKKIIDPFTGKNNFESCGTIKKSLWKKEIDLHYQPFNIQSASFLDSVPDLKKIERNNNIKQTISTDAKIFTFWSVFLGVRKDDIIKLEIKDPNGKLFANNTITQDKTRAKQFYYIGKNLRNKPLIEGAYTGFVELTRKSKNGEDVTKNKIFNVLVTK